MKEAEKSDLINPCGLGDLAGGGAEQAPPRKDLRRPGEEPLAGGRKSGGGRHECKCVLAMQPEWRWRKGFVGGRGMGSIGSMGKMGGMLPIFPMLRMLPNEPRPPRQLPPSTAARYAAG